VVTSKVVAPFHPKMVKKTRVVSRLYSVKKSGVEFPPMKEYCPKCRRSFEPIRGLGKMKFLSYCPVCQSLMRVIEEG
jgi:hypothetical protein